VISIDRALKSTSDLRVIASDADSNRMIIAIGRERFAYDVIARITELPCRFFFEGTCGQTAR